ncbi:interferon gamma 1 [Alosa sapidissima]|uniref:interferon gamma 1 n=1 Tax=Alosa sapidissima TaxID=34773 RepID=UPI001C09A07E|nr:interferon gamma 1 [Alosa sapidissima]
MATVAHHLKQALIWAVICLMAGEVMGNKEYFSKKMEAKQKNVDKFFANRGPFPAGALFRQLDNQTLQKQTQIQMLLAGETLKVYDNILTNLRDKMQANKARDDVDYLRSKVEELKTMYFNETQKQLEALTNNLKELQAINTSDEVVQRKAIFELKKVYNRVSSLGEASKNQTTFALRRRRQLRRRSIKPRA